MKWGNCYKGKYKLVSTEACHETKMYKRIVVKQRKHRKNGD